MGSYSRSDRLGSTLNKTRKTKQRKWECIGKEQRGGLVDEKLLRGIIRSIVFWLHQPKRILAEVGQGDSILLKEKWRMWNQIIYKGRQDIHDGELWLN